MKLTQKDIKEGFDGFSEFKSAEESFSPCFSNTGLVFRNGSGNPALYFHYNRATRPVFGALIKTGLRADKTLSSAECAVLGGKKGSAFLTCWDTDCFMFSSETLERVQLFASPAEETTGLRLDEKTESLCILRGYSKNPDARDPDKTVPFAVCVKAEKGRLEYKNGRVFAEAGSKGITLHFAVCIMTFDRDETLSKLASAPRSITAARKMCRSFFSEFTKNADIHFSDEKEKRLLTKAVAGLAFNTALAPGKLSNGNISLFPNRGTYPTHFLWDTCFENLALELLNPELAAQGIMQLVLNIRPDGKIPQFICPTWDRPVYSQPALTGWAAVRNPAIMNSPERLETVYGALCRNNAWWLNSRMTEYGLISCENGLETGQDDSPRFDGRTTLSCDMNSYLLNQINCVCAMAEKLGLETEAAKHRALAEDFASKMVKNLYCAEDNIFYDVDTADGSFVKIVTPNCILPLWAGVSPGEDKAEAMIEKYLLGKDYLFGDIPFPSVAYGEKTYISDGWWRGPTWMPESMLCLETLRRYGYNKEEKEAARRLVSVMKKDSAFHELFDSRSGKGLGSEQQTWTQAVFIKLTDELNRRK